LEYASFPRLMVRLEWDKESREGGVGVVEEDVMNPWSTYFESEWMGTKDEEGEKGTLKGVSGDILSGGQTLSSRKKTKGRDAGMTSSTTTTTNATAPQLQNDGYNDMTDESRRRRLTALLPDETPSVQKLDESHLLTSNDATIAAIPPSDDASLHPPPHAEEFLVDHGEDDRNYRSFDDVIDDLNYDYEGYEVDDRRDSYYALRNYIGVDPHVWATPMLVEMSSGVENKREPVLLVPMSYYFDEDQYQDGGTRASRHSPAANEKLSSADGRASYGGTAIAGYNLFTKRWSVQIHLDMADHRNTNDTVPRPLLADVDGDGREDIVIGTRLGYLHAVTARTGRSVEGFPVRLGGMISSRVIVGAFSRERGEREILVLDSRGCVYCIDARGGIVWSTRLVGEEEEADGAVVMFGELMVGDVDGDGELDVVTSLVNSRTGSTKIIMEGGTGARGTDDCDCGQTINGWWDHVGRMHRFVNWLSELESRAGMIV